jgi:mannose-6-phosphate isomerase-like protein (cupin superfamily)
MPDYSIMSFSSAPGVPFNLDGRILFSSGNYELVHLTLQTGETMEKHTQPFDIVFFVVEGRGSLVVGEESAEIDELTAVYVHSGVPRAWTNSGNRPLKILVNKLLATH